MLYDYEITSGLTLIKDKWKAFFGIVPFPSLHIDTTFKFKEMIEDVNLVDHINNTNEFFKKTNKYFSD